MNDFKKKGKGNKRKSETRWIVLCLFQLLLFTAWLYRRLIFLACFKTSREPHPKLQFRKVLRRDYFNAKNFRNSLKVLKNLFSQSHYQTVLQSISCVVTSVLSGFCSEAFPTVTSWFIMINFVIIIQIRTALYFGVSKHLSMTVFHSQNS